MMLYIYQCPQMYDSMPHLKTLHETIFELLSTLKSRTYLNEGYHNDGDLRQAAQLIWFFNVVPDKYKKRLIEEPKLIYIPVKNNSTGSNMHLALLLKSHSGIEWYVTNFEMFHTNDEWKLVQKVEFQW